MVTSELLLQFMIKYEAIFFLTEIRIITPDPNNAIYKNFSDLKKLLKKTKFKISIIQNKALLNPWKDSISLDLYDFLSLFLLKNEDDLPEFLLRFFNNVGFLKSDQTKLISTLRKKLTIENLKISIKSEDKNVKSNKKTKEKIINNDYFVILPETENETKPLCLSQQNSSEIVIFTEGITKLENYNTIKYLNKSKYYFSVVENQLYKNLRIIFSEDESILLSIYSPFQKKTEYHHITNIREIVKK